MTLYENIKKRREELKMSQEQLAKKMGYKSRASINKIEKGKADIPQSKIMQFAKELGVSPGELMGWVQLPTDKEKMGTGCVAYGSPTEVDEPDPFTDRPDVVAPGNPIFIESKGHPSSTPLGSLAGYLNYLSSTADPETRKNMPIIVEGQKEKALIESYRSLSDKDKETVASLIQSLPKDTKQ